jgi:S1-C subfamily serine protease
MDIEQLSKSQIVLLTLLVSFVTSMATGIVAVSLMEQASPTVAQTVNRVIERTVEKVVPSESQPASAATVVTKEKTVVVKETDLVAQAVAKASPSLVRVYADPTPGASFLGLGVIVNASGLVAFDAGALNHADAVVVFPDGSRAQVSVANRNEIAGVVFLMPASSTLMGAPLPKLAPAELAVGTPTLGETTVVLAGQASTRIASSLVTSVSPKSATVPLDLIETDASAGSIVAGSPLIDLNGAVVGFSTYVARNVNATAFVPAIALVPPVQDKPAP